MHKTGSFLCSDYCPITFFIENKPILCCVCRHVSTSNHCPGLAGSPWSTVRLPPGHQPADEVAAHEPLPDTGRAPAPEAIYGSTHAPHFTEILHPHAVLCVWPHLACRLLRWSPGGITAVCHKMAALLVTWCQHCNCSVCFNTSSRVCGHCSWWPVPAHPFLKLLLLTKKPMRNVVNLQSRCVIFLVIPATHSHCSCLGQSLGHEWVIHYIRIPTSHTSNFKLGWVFALFPWLTQYRPAKSIATIVYFDTPQL